MRVCKSLCVSALVLFVAAGCMVSIDGWSSSSSSVWGQDVEVHDSYLVVDDVRLDHVRWEEVELSTEDVELMQVGTASEGVRLTGEDGATARLRVHLYSEIEGDGTVTFEGDRLMAVSDRGKVFINSVEGTIPGDLDLKVATGTGEILLTSVATDRTLTISTGTGEMELAEVAPALLSVETGTGDLRAKGGGAETAVVESGTGDVWLSGGAWGEIRMESGTGDLVIKDCTTTAVRFTSGTGDLVLNGGACGKASIESGTGDLILRGDAVVEEIRER
ncbi:MAG: DUF4097 family beta strand repeat-containing protein [Planctomycetota bacterium]|jgi:hypothetical protein